LLGKVLWEEFEPLKEQVGYREFHRAIRDNCTVVFEEFYEPYQILSEIRAYPSEEGLTVYFRDITQDRKIKESLRLSEERFQIVAKSSTDAIWDWDLTTKKNWRSENIQNLFGYTSEDFDGPMELWSDRIHPDDRMRVLDNLHAAVHGQANNWIDEYRFIRKDGSVATVLDRGSIIRDSKGHAIRMVGAMVDLTERRQADARIREQAALLDKAKDAIVVRGVDNRVHYWNKGAERLYGWTAEEAVGRSVAELLYDDPTHLHEATRRVLETGEWSGEITERRKDGTPLPVEVHWTLMRDEAGEPQSIFAIKTDITRRKADEHKIQRLAFYDSLTQLPNRQLLMDRVQRAIASSARSAQTSALLFIDLDDFKTLNDASGHTMGDLLLQQVAQRLTACVRSSDTVARLGGDEFVVMLENISNNLDEATAQTRTVSETILKALGKPYQLENFQHISTSSIGITLFDSHAEDASELLKRADLAMYQAKAAGGNTLRFFDPTMQAAISARVSMEADLRQSLREREFCLHFQPQVDMHGRMIGLEALVRWQHPRKGLVSPAEFIALAEETGLILPLGEWVLETACRQLATWADKPEAAHLEIAVNVSAYQFRHPGFVEQVLGALGRTGANPRRLKLELTESMLIDNVEDTIMRMNMLKARGIGFALDDFGTGYSSLVYLRRLPLDILKIDRSFIRDLLVNPNDVVIAQMIIALAGNLGLKVIAEGVETEAQRDLLFQHGCDAYQGYLYSKPLPADEISALIRDGYEGHA
jgi:diguanylate cyclase (GGDEF)-like protein/PAS domain S-box-containing protein